MKHLTLTLLLASALLQPSAKATDASIELTLPAIDTAQYYRPYVAVWIEDEQQQPVKLLALWRKEPDWLKDLRRFWRKIGRSQDALVDASTGATRTAGAYTLRWDGSDNQGRPLPAGHYTLLVEAAREQGGRSLQKIAFQFGGPPQTASAAAAEELGLLTFNLK